MHNDFERFCVSSHDDDFGDSSVESLSGLVGSFLELTFLSSLSDESLNFDGQIVFGKGSSSALCFFFHFNN